tara:strand:- start:506 stop:1039 length:534 start_codon:yes stop_codon:yes gene_type:complete
MNQSNNIFLIGPMATGKTTIGKKLAKKTSKKFYDSDAEIKKITGADISLIFEIEGDAGFRKRETKIISQLVTHSNIVLSTGGGAVLAEKNRNMLTKNGVVIYLKSSAKKIFDRTNGDKSRPLLQGNNSLSKIKEILKEREHLYESLANEVISTESFITEKIIQEILKKIKKYEKNNS